MKRDLRLAASNSKKNKLNSGIPSFLVMRSDSVWDIRSIRQQSNEAVAQDCNGKIAGQDSSNVVKSFLRRSLAPDCFKCDSSDGCPGTTWTSPITENLCPWCVPGAQDRPSYLTPVNTDCDSTTRGCYTIDTVFGQCQHQELPGMVDCNYFTLTQCQTSSCSSDPNADKDGDGA